MLASSGVDHVKIELLAKKLDISKGSFYHYWRNRAEFLDALLTYWEERGTIQIIETLEAISSPHERLQRLFESSFSYDKSLEAAIHHWANVDALVAQRIARTEQRRIAYIAQLLSEIGNPAAKASELAQVYYFIYLGWIDWSQRNDDVESQQAKLQRQLFKITLSDNAPGAEE
jgi:AcrR family transcriptional regulator